MERTKSGQKNTSRKKIHFHPIAEGQHTQMV
nr:MAG TPA: hypothetical protein [Caudoviricetes sp.]